MAKLSDQQIHEELVRREVERRKLANERREKHHQFILANIDNLLAMRPEHDRTSCSDDDPCNNSSDVVARQPRCLRCQLLKTKNDKWVDDFTLTLTLVVTPELPLDNITVTVR